MAAAAAAVAGEGAEARVSRLKIARVSNHRRCELPALSVVVQSKTRSRVHLPSTPRATSSFPLPCSSLQVLPEPEPLDHAPGLLVTARHLHLLLHVPHRAEPRPHPRPPLRRPPVTRTKHPPPIAPRRTEVQRAAPGTATRASRASPASACPGPPLPAPRPQPVDGRFPPPWVPQQREEHPDDGDHHAVNLHRYRRRSTHELRRLPHLEREVVRVSRGLGSVGCPV